MHRLPEKAKPRRKFNALPSSITALFPNPTLLDVLSLLMLHPDSSFYQREISERVSSSLLQAQRALRRIESAGLVVKQRRGNRIYYSADHRHPAFKDFRKLLLKTVALGDYLRDALSGIDGKIQLAFVFGSIAAGSESAVSDIDLFVVGDVSSRQISATLGPLGKKLGREFNAVQYTEKELRKKVRSGNHFIKELLPTSKIWLLGSEDEFAKMVE